MNDDGRTINEKVKDRESLIAWLRGNRIDEVECLVSDMNGVMRGKIVPREDFISAIQKDGLRVPESVLVTTVTGDCVEDSEVAPLVDSDIYITPDPSTIRIVPWYEEPTAQIICDAKTKSGRHVDYAPRSVLKNVLKAYAKRGLKPIVAPELEFYFVEKNLDPDYPLTVPKGLSGRREAGRQPYGIEAANEFDPVVNRTYDYCEAMDIWISTMAHESGAAQFEMNFRHGDPLELADQVFLFKRVVRQAALKEGFYATFMAQPHMSEPGSAMHIHQSVLSTETGKNIFADSDGNETDALMHYIGGLQRFTPEVTALLCPNVNSFRRMRLESDAPINLHWGRDNRTCGLRVPDAEPAAKRVENRVVGADANPYLAMAATLACGLLGMDQKLTPGSQVKGDAHELEFGLPRHLPDALALLRAATDVQTILGSRFATAFAEVKEVEINHYNRVISSWERENLLLSI